MSEHIITLRQGSNDKRPWPIKLNGRRASSGLGRDDGAHLIGFSKPDTQRMEVTAEEGLANPELVVGLWPIFSNEGGMFDWAVEVESIRDVSGG